MIIGAGDLCGLDPLAHVWRTIWGPVPPITLGAGMNEQTRAGRLAPSIGWMHYGLALTGLGTALLGPILPLIARQWSLLDSQSGLLMTAKFVGATLGGMSVMKDLRHSMIVGTTAAALGFGGFALAAGFEHGMGAGCVGLFVGGFGLGQMITSINILAGR